ncbi:MAG: ATP-binding cassette domain-containing protein [Candidatus Methanomethylophilaceae archaeon]|nr:ATP-binding cassette domain-containing protein [Candidatus Methanomethylophilaceae archaeon]
MCERMADQNGSSGDDLEHSISAEGLSKSFHGFQAVDGVSFQVRKGEFFGILGPNGAGKTTTIRMLTGVLKPDQGRILIDGIDLRRDALAAKQRMGVIPEVGTVYTDLSARENLELFGMYYGLSKPVRQERATQMLKDLELHDRADDLVKTFSKGMKQRISIGCAMVHDPSVLFLDEPTEGLDVQSRKLILDRVRAMNAAGCTVVITTHNIEEASRLCQRVCIINKGQVVTVDSPEHLKSTFEQTRSVEVAFEGQVSCQELSPSCMLRVEESGDKMRIFTSDPDRTIEEIMRLRDERGLRILSLSTLGPSLEDVFLKLTEAKR